MSVGKNYPGMDTTVITSKGTTTIPQRIRQQSGAYPGSRLSWDFKDGVIQAIVRSDEPNQLQQRIRRLAGAWDGGVSGEQLLQRTRP
jgi:bifunctional DNA-binding transcriptional regulator/antitoxin component of YhaV-PrlF toxin-antitoxin module